MGNINSGDESDHDLISTDMLEDIRDGSQTHPNVNRIEAHYKIREDILCTYKKDNIFIQCCI